MRINLLEDYKNIILKLNDDIRTDAPMDPTDIFNTKTNLNRLGYYPKPDFGITKYTDEGLFSGLKNFQKDNNLKVDGIMRIGGETETTMREKITFKNRDRYSNDNQTSYRNKIKSDQPKQDIKQNTQTKTEKIVKYRFEAKGSNSCDECMQYDGQIFDKKEDAPKLPIHPNCNCKLHEVVSHKNIEVKSEEIISKDYKMSEKGIEFLKGEEGKVVNSEGKHVPYLCSANKKTIGYGHVMNKQEVNKYKNGISEKKADELLKKDTKITMTTLKKTIKRPLKQNEVDSVGSLIYNIGGSRLKETKTKKMIENNQTKDKFTGKTLRDEFIEFRNITVKENNVKKLKRLESLENRRHREMDIYEEGNYKPKPVNNSYEEKLRNGRLI